MTDIATPPAKGNQTNGKDTDLGKTRKPRTINETNLQEQIARQPLEAKVSLLKFLQNSIQADKKKLEDQLKLIG